MNNKPSVSTGKILDWLEGRLDSAEIATLRTQMNVTDEKSLSWYEKFLERIDGIVLGNVPEKTRSAIRSEYSESTPSVWRQIQAVLSYDSWNLELGNALNGVRASQQMSQTRQLMFSSSDYNVAIDVTPSSHQFDIDGQIIPTSDDDETEDFFVVQLIRDEQSVQIVASDDIGEFELKNVDTGQYQLVCTGERDELVASLYLLPVGL